MAVAFDAVGPSSSGAGNTGTSPLTWTHTCGAGATALYVAIAIGHTASTFADSAATVTATYNGIAMTALSAGQSTSVASGLNTVSSSSTGMIKVFRLASPPTGSAYTVSVSVSGTLSSLCGGSISVTGSGGEGTLAQGSTSGASSASGSIGVAGTTSGGLVLAFIGDGSGGEAVSGGATLRYKNDVNTSTSAGNTMAESLASPGGTATMSWTQTSDAYAVIAFEVQPPAAPAVAPAAPAPAVPPGLLSPMALRGPVSRAYAPRVPVFTPVPMTVTATQTGATSAGMLLRVRVLDNTAATQNGGTATQTGAGSHQATVTTTQTGSKVYCAMCLGAAGPMTAATGTTLDDNYQDGTNTQNYATGHATALTGTPGAATVGSSLPNGNGGSCAVAEILPSGAIGDDGTAPPVVTSNSATSLTTASFTPTAGTLLVAMMGTHWASGVTTFTVTDSLGLTWTPLAQANGSNQGYAGIWVARVPGGQPAALSLTAGLATATAGVPTPSTSIQNITVDFTTAVTVTSPLGIGYTISTYSGGGQANINASATWKNSLAALGATHCRIPLRWNGGNPGSGAGGAQTSGDADTYIANIKAIGAIPLVAFTGDTSDNGFASADAGSFVTHYNGSGGQNNGPVHYWIVGNEPDNTGGTGPYESILPATLTAMHGADATVKVFAPAAAYWDTSLISAVAADAVDGLDYHAYDGANTDGTGFPTSPQYYSHIKTDLPGYKAGILYAVTEANWHSGYTGDPNWYTWENTCFIADAAGQVLSAGGSFTQYSDSGGCLSLMNDGAGTNNQPGSFGTTFPAYMGLGIWTGMAGQFKGLSANMATATTAFAQGQLSVFACDNGKIVAVNKETASKTLTIGMTLPGGATAGTYNVWATNYASPLSAITEVVTAAAYTNSTISYVIPAGTAVSIDVSTNVSAGLASATGSAGGPGIALTAGLASGTGTAYNATLPAPTLNVTAGLAAATGAAAQPGIMLAAALAAGNGAAAQPGTGLGAGLAAGTGAASAVSAPARTAGLAAGTGDAGLATATDLAVSVAQLAAATGAAQNAAAGNTVAAGLAAATGAAAQPGIALTAGLAAGTGAVQNVSAGTTAAAGLATGTGAASAVSAPARGATLAAGTGTALTPGPGLTAPLAAATGTAWSAVPLVTAAAGLATGTGDSPPALVTDGLALPIQLAAATAAAQSPLPLVIAAAGLATGTGSALSPPLGLTPGLAAGTGTAQAPAAGTTVTAGLAAGTGTAWNPVASAGATVMAGLATGTGTAQAPASLAALIAALAAGTAAAGQPGPGLTAPLAAGTGTAYPAVPLAIAAAGLATGTGDSPPALVTDGLAIPVQLAASTGTAQPPVPLVTVAAGLATGTGSAQSPSAGLTAGLAAGTGTALAAPALIAPAAQLATGTGTAWNPVASAGATVLAQLAAATGTAQPGTVAAVVTAGLAAGTGAALQPGTGLGAGLAAGTGTGQAVTVLAAVTAGRAAGTGAAQAVTASSGTTQVTATQGGATKNGILLRVKVLTGAAVSQPGGTGTQSGIGSHQAPVTTTVAGSQVYLAIALGAIGPLTAATGTALTDNYSDSPNVQCYGTGEMTAPTVTPQTVTVGATLPNGNGGGCAAAEILPAVAGTPPAEDASAPANAAVATGAITTASLPFTPPAGALLVALVATDWGAGVTTMTVSDNTGLTWTELVKSNGTNQNYSGVWAAQVPGAGLSVTAGLATATGSALAPTALGGTVTSPALVVSGFGSFPQIPPGSAVTAVIANITWYGSDAAVTAPSYELWDGTTAIIGSPQQGTASTSPHADSVVFTGVTYAQLATLQLRIYATSQTGNAGAVAAFDAASLSVQWTLSQNATVQRPATLAVVPTLPAVTVEVDAAASPATLAITPAFPAPSPGLLNTSAVPAALPVPVTLPASAASAGTTASPGLLTITPAFPAPSAGLLNATASPAALPAPVVLPGPSVAAGTSAAPGTLAVTPAFPAPSAGLLNSAVAPAVLPVPVVLPASAVSATMNASVSPGVLAVVPAFPAIISVTAPGWAAAAAGTGWTNPGNAEGTPDAQYATWTF